MSETNESPVRRQLTRSAILAKTEMPRRFVSTPEWADGDVNAGVWVRGMTGRERDEYETRKGEMIRTAKDAGAEYDRGTWRAEFVQLCAVTETGVGMFNATDVQGLASLSAAPLDRLYDAIAELSGIGSKAEEAARKN